MNEDQSNMTEKWKEARAGRDYAQRVKQVFSDVYDGKPIRDFDSLFIYLKACLNKAVELRNIAIMEGNQLSFAYQQGGLDVIHDLMAIIKRGFEPEEEPEVKGYA